MTIANLLAMASQKVDHLDAELLLAHLLGKPREYLLTHLDEEIDWWQSHRYRRLVTKRKHHIPLAYLTGKKAFYGFDFFVDKHELVPRPETELLVNEAINAITEPVTVVDVGTGTGCIVISILKSITQNKVRAFGTDISKRALRVAKKNAKHHHAQATFLHGNLLEPVAQLPGPLLITANLPYLTREQVDDAPSIQREPKTALIAAENGLALYDALLLQLRVMCNNPPNAEPRTLNAFFEIDPTQSGAITEMIKQYFPDADVEMRKDLAGLDRVVCVELS